MMKKIIGLTGGIGAGKTAVAHILEARGYPVYNSDTRAKVLVSTDASLQQGITRLLGAEAYTRGVYNTAFVSSLVFKDAGLLKQLNQLIHPVVRRDFQSWCIARDAGFLFKETALLFELGLNLECYKSLLVTADTEVRTARVAWRDGKTSDIIAAIMQKQMPEQDKILLADFVIYNNTTLEDLQPQVDAVLSALKQAP